MNRHERRAARISGKVGTGSIAPSTPTPSTPDAGDPPSLEVALAHLQAGRHLDAQLGCRQALAVDPNHAEALHLMGQISLHAKQHDHAIEWIARAIRQDPKPEYLASLGTALQQQGRREEAVKAFDKAVQLRPDDADLWMKFGNALRESGRGADAVLALQHVLKFSPGHWDAAYAAAGMLHQLGRFEEAIASFDRCRDLRPDHAVTLQLRGLSLLGLKRYDECLADSLAAHALDPGSAETCNNIGTAFLGLGRAEQALTWFDKALEIKPRLAEVLNNKAASLGQLHRFSDAFALCDRMKALGLNNARTEWVLAHLHLLTGNFEAGWTENEVRLTLPTSNYPKFPLPMWRGDEDARGKTILVCADEGLGDTIQFVRYVPMLIERGARVVLVVQNPLYPLLSRLQGLSQCFSFDGGQLPPIDMHCPVCSLPFAFKTRLDTIPSATSYLPPIASERIQAWEDRLGPHDKLRVGLAWSGSLTHTNDHNRSVPLQMFSTILDIDAAFISLQKDPRPDDAAVLRERGTIADFTAGLTDFTETAALVSCLDLMITVDTSVAHLSAALGRPTWILLPYTPDFRWLLDRDDSPWYPTARLFRQDQTRDYVEVLARVRNELESRAAAFRPGQSAAQ